MKQVVATALALYVGLFSHEIERKPWKVGVALSGGAALGLAHIGVLKVLEEEGIPISCISGTSMGSIVAGMYAAGYSAHEMDSILTGVDWSALFSERIPPDRITLARREEEHRNLVELTHRWFVPHIPSGAVSLQNVEILLTDFLAAAEYDAGYDFDSLVVPFRCVAVDVASGELAVFRRGSMVEAIRASIAIPGVFSPARLNGEYYVDGGVIQSLPVEPLLEFEPDFIIASDVIRWGPRARSLIDVVTRSMAIISERGRARQRKLASVVLYPNVDEFLPSDFPRASELVAAGEAAARRAVPAIKQRLRDHPLVLERNPLYPRPKPVVGKIEVVGLEVTRERFVRRHIAMRPGEVLDFAVLVDDLVRLRETGLFRHVSHHLEFSDSTVDVIFTLEEKDYGRYGLSFHYDNVYDFAVRLEVAQGNLGGTGARLSFAATLGEPQDFRVGLAGSRFLTLPFTYRVEGYTNETAHFAYDPLSGAFDYRYTTLTWGADAEFGYGLGRRGYFTLGYSHRRHIHRLPIIPDDTNTVSAPTFRLRVSTLDELSLPSRGFDLTLRAKLGLASLSWPEGFFKTSIAAQRCFPFGERVVLGLGLRYGVGMDTLPRAELFRLGGACLVGAREESFAVEEYLAGRVMLAYRLFSLFGNPHYPFRLELVTDVAAFNPIVKSTGILEETFTGTGVGVGTNTPLGPVRAWLGISSDRTFSVHLSVGSEPRERM